MHLANCREEVTGTATKIEAEQVMIQEYIVLSRARNLFLKDGQAKVTD